MYDDQNFYLAAEVFDQSHVSGGSGMAATKGDCLVLSIDPARGTADSSRAAFQVILAKHGSVPVMFRPAKRSGVNSRTGNLNVDGAVSACAVAVTDEGMTYEVVLPIGEMRPFVPGFGRKLGLTVTLIDHDKDGRTGTVEWGAGAGAGWNTTLFGVLTLIETE